MQADYYTIIIRMKKELTVGVDIGGSHITAGFVNMQDKTAAIDTVVRQKVNSKASADEIIAAWCRVIRNVWSMHGVSNTRLGFAMPGPFDYEEGICQIKGFDKYESLYQMNIRQELSSRLNVSGHDILFRNDAEAFLDGELFCGAGQGYKHAIGITLGTGLGSAVSHNGNTKDAALSVLEYCGDKIEEQVSTRGLINSYHALTGVQLKDAETIASLYATDEHAVQVFKKFGEGLSWFLEYFIKKENPEVLIIAGNIANAMHLFMPDVKNNLIAAGVRLPEIVKSTLNENAALIGGACCFIKELKESKTVIE